MNFDELVKLRKSSRDFDGSPVTDAELEAIIEAARLAPSACNSQPWRFFAVNTPERVKALARGVQDMGMNKFASDAGALIVVTEAHATLKTHVAERLSSQHFAAGDIGIATAHIVLKAAEMGLQTCILGWLDPKYLAENLGITDGRKIHYVIAVGHGKDVSVREKSRKTLAEIYKKAD